MMYKDLELRKEKIRNFIRKNPRATWAEIKRKLSIKLERVYKQGIGEAFKEAGIKPPRTFKRKTKEENENIIIDYIKKHPKAGGHSIRKDTKINFLAIFKNTKEAYEKAGIKYPHHNKKSAEIRRKEIIDLIKKDNLITISEIIKKLHTNPYKFFKNNAEMYQQAGIRKIKRMEKRRIRKRNDVIQFIKNNCLSTQREINNACKTHVQRLFKRGIFEAYEKAGIKFPYERLRLYGTALREIKKRAVNFENTIAIRLSGYGKVNRLIKTKRGFADIILERMNKKAVIEIKDYLAKDISISQINQLNKYLEDINCELGFIICHKKPRKDKFLIGENKIIILDESELSKIPKLIRGT